MFWVKIVLFKRWHESTQLYRISKPTKYFCKFGSLLKIENACFGRSNPLRVIIGFLHFIIQYIILTNDINFQMLKIEFVIF